MEWPGSDLWRWTDRVIPWGGHVEVSYLIINLTVAIWKLAITVMLLHIFRRHVERGLQKYLQSKNWVAAHLAFPCGLTAQEVAKHVTGSGPAHDSVLYKVSCWAVSWDIERHEVCSSTKHCLSSGSVVPVDWLQCNCGLITMCVHI